MREPSRRNQGIRNRYDSLVGEVVGDSANFEAMYPRLYSEVIELMQFYSRHNGDNNNNPEFLNGLDEKVKGINEELKGKGGRRKK